VEAPVSGRVVVVSSCTATKIQTPSGKARWAESLYIGQQHMRLMQGVKQYREAEEPAGELCFQILSAYHGLLSARRSISSYDHSFSGMPTEVIREQGLQREVPSDIRKLLRKSFDLGLLLLGDPYLRACDLDVDVELGGPLLCFCSPAVARRMPAIPGLRTIPLANAEARRFSCGLIALKGELGGRLLSRLAAEPETIDSLASPHTDILRQLESPRSRRREQPIAA
jgi:hypothetical protein